MLVGIHKDQYGDFNQFYHPYEQTLDHNGIDHVRLETSQPDFWDRIAQLDLLIFRWSHFDSDRQKALSVLPIIEQEMHIPCFPNLATCWHYDDKIRQYYLMARHGFPMVSSYIFWEKDYALAWARSADYPVVFKLRGGAASQNVILVEDHRHACRLIQRMFGLGIRPDCFHDKNHLRFSSFSIKREIRRLGRRFHNRLQHRDHTPFWQVQKNYALFQRFLPNNTYDTRITVIGDRAFGFRRFVRANDFRASGGGNIDLDPTQIDPRMINIAFEVSQATNFQSMAYDFLYDQDHHPQFCEISYTYDPNWIFFCPGYWDPDLNWHPGAHWPQYLHLVDALKLPDLQQPEIQPKLTPSAQRSLQRLQTTYDPAMSTPMSPTVCLADGCDGQYLTSFK